MAQSALATIIDNQPIAETAASAPTGRMSMQAVQPTINGGFLTEFFKDIDNNSRVRTLLQRLNGLTLEERDKAIRSYKEANKVPGPKGKDVVDPVASTRASEVRILWVALNKIGLHQDEMEGKGYHKAVAFARQYVNECGLDSDGETKLSTEQKIERKEGKAKADAMAQALLDNPIKAGESMADHLARVSGIVEGAATEALDQLDDKRAESIFKRLVEKENSAVLAKLANLIADHLTSEAKPEAE